MFYLEESGSEWTEEHLELLLETSALVEILIESNQLQSDNSIPEQTGDLIENCTNLFGYLSSVCKVFEGQATQMRLEAFKSKYKLALNTTFHYEFSQGDLDRIQSLINELREYINKNENLEAGHKQRLLKRLEKLQMELHKKVSDLDRFWGMLGDAGIVLGKLGKDAKPVVDRIKELSEIVWRTQARTEELPSDTPSPLLESEND